MKSWLVNALHVLYAGWSLQTRSVIRSHASANVSSQYGCCSRVSFGVALSTCTCTRAEAGPFCVVRRISVSVSKFILLKCITERNFPGAHASACSVPHLAEHRSAGRMPRLGTQDARAPRKNRVVAQASCLWGNRASRLIGVAKAGKMPARPTDKEVCATFCLSCL